MGKHQLRGVSALTVICSVKEISLVSRRIINNFMVSNKSKAHQVEINIEMIKAVSSASLKYKTYLDENRKLQAKE